MIHDFCRYPYNNFLHYHVENVIVSCLESKATLLIEHLLHDCDLVGKILAADNNPTLALDSKVTFLFEIAFIVSVILSVSSCCHLA